MRCGFLNLLRVLLHQGQDLRSKSLEKDIRTADERMAAELEMTSEEWLVEHERLHRELGESCRLHRDFMRIKIQEKDNV